MISRIPVFFAPATLILSSILAVGCHQPESEADGRVNVTETTRGERRSSQVLPAALIEFSDQVIQEIPQKLVEIPQIKALNDARIRITVIMGDIENKTGNVSSNDFEMVRSRIRNGVLQSQFVRERVAFVENRARMGALAAREQVGTPSGTGGPAPYDPQSTFALNGTFYRVNRNSSAGDTNQYYMEFQLVNFATNEIVSFLRFEVKQWKP